MGAVPCRGTNSLRGVQHVQKIIYINACIFPDLMTGPMRPMKRPDALHSEGGGKDNVRCRGLIMAFVQKKVTRVQSFLGILRVRSFQVEGRVRAYKCLYKERGIGRGPPQGRKEDSNSSHVETRIH